VGDPQSLCLQVSCACVPDACVLTWFRDTTDGSLPLEEGLPPILEEERERSGRRSRSFGAAAVIAGLCCASVVAVLAMRFKHVPVVELVQNSQVRVAKPPSSLHVVCRLPENSNPTPYSCALHCRRRASSSSSPRRTPQRTQVAAERL
jgi:hypothetical protein